MSEGKLGRDEILRRIDQIRAVAVEGLNYAVNSYDSDRYTRLLEAVADLYGSYLDIASAEVRNRFRQELGSCTPKIGVNIAVISTQGRLLVLRRSDDKTWCLPCGWVGVGEAMEDAAKRETEEETGLQIATRGVAPRGGS